MLWSLKARKTCLFDCPFIALSQRYKWTFIRPAESTLSDDEDDEEEVDTDAEEERHYAFPELDAQIRRIIKEYGAVFPKLNFSSPKVCTSLPPRFEQRPIIYRTHRGFYSHLLP